MTLPLYVRTKCPICGYSGPEAETFEEAANLAREAGFVGVRRIRDGFSPRYAVCSVSCYERIIEFL